MPAHSCCIDAAAPASSHNNMLLSGASRPQVFAQRAHGTQPTRIHLVRIKLQVFRLLCREQEVFIDSRAGNDNLQRSLECPNLNPSRHQNCRDEAKKQMNKLGTRGTLENS